jgi:hypothetical protein
MEAAPIMLTCVIDLTQLQKQLRRVITQSFEFRNTRNETRIVTRDMLDSSAEKDHLEKNSLSYSFETPLQWAYLLG